MGIASQQSPLLGVVICLYGHRFACRDAVNWGSRNDITISEGIREIGISKFGIPFHEIATRSIRISIRPFEVIALAHDLKCKPLPC